MPKESKVTFRLTVNEFERLRVYASHRCITLSAALRKLVSDQIPANGWSVGQVKPIVRRDTPWW